MEALLAEICVNKEDQDGCVEELYNESDLSRLLQLLRLSSIADPCDKFDANRAQDKVHNRNEVLQETHLEFDFGQNGLVFSADRNIFRVTERALQVCTLGNLSLAEALKRSKGGHTLVLNHKIVISDGVRLELTAVRT